MNESSRNARTLIVSFVLAIMVLIPLRFVEAGTEVGQPQVLGQEVVLPETGTVAAPVLEAPYDKIDGVQTDCISQEEAAGVLAADKATIENGGLDGATIDQLINDMVSVEARTCK